jgi:hypothetical protein
MKIDQKTPLSGAGGLLITTVKSDADVQGILDLQQANLKKNISQETIESQGFVTVEHDLKVLRLMNDAEPSIIAKDGEKVVGYCLAMLPQFRNEIPILASLFDAIDKIAYEGTVLKNYKYLVMGQVCVGDGYRGIGLFDKMYHKMREELAAQYEFCITDIAKSNQRSVKAHTRVGFEVVHEFYEEKLNETWIVVAWDWRKLN